MLRRLCFNAVNLVISKSIQSVHYCVSVGQNDTQRKIYFGRNIYACNKL